MKHLIFVLFLIEVELTYDIIDGMLLTGVPRYSTRLYVVK